MRSKPLLVLAVCLTLLGLVVSSTASPEILQEEKQKSGSIENPILRMTQSMANLLFTNQHIKKIVGDPIKVGKVTIIPIMIIDIGYGGGQGGVIENIQPGGGFYCHGEAKPLGFVIISKSGSTFLSAGKAPRK